MNRAEIVEFARNNPICFIATAADNTPFVRTVMLHSADDSGLIFSTWKQKDFYRQIVQNPRVEICLYNPQQGRQIRLSGVLEALSDESLKDEIIRKFRFLNTQVQKMGRDSLVVYRLAKGQATSWTLSTAFEDKVYVDF